MHMRVQLIVVAFAVALQLQPASSSFWSVVNSGQSSVWPTAVGSTVATCAVAAACSLKVVTTGNEALVERLGKYHRKLSAGWHVVVPLFESVSISQTTREQVLDVPPQVR